VIVLDASAVVELVARGPLSPAIRHELAMREDALIVPHLLDVEVANALRGMGRSRNLSEQSALEALANLASLPADRFEHTLLLGRIWELRHNFTAYDATYIALAEWADATLLTCDAKMVNGHRARVLLIRG
jgi:predicted nucleic acid-binding protein